MLSDLPMVEAVAVEPQTGTHKVHSNFQLCRGLCLYSLHFQKSAMSTISNFFLSYFYISHLVCSILRKTILSSQNILTATSVSNCELYNYYTQNT